MKGERYVRSKLRRLLADAKERLTGTLGWHGTVIGKECTLQLCEPPTRLPTHLSRLEREQGEQVGCSILLRSVAASFCSSGTRTASPRRPRKDAYFTSSNNRAHVQLRAIIGVYYIFMKYE